MEQIMIYELRIYRCVPGRLPALLSRFQNDTLRIWEKHGIRQAGFWTTLIGESDEQLTFMLAWDTMPERETLGRIPRRPLMESDRHRDREGRPTRTEHQQAVAGANGVFLGE